eukprot:scaffold274324_cov22-Tisochrysis_lutea.AAC.1
MAGLAPGNQRFQLSIPTEFLHMHQNLSLPCLKARRVQIKGRHKGDSMTFVWGWKALLTCTQCKHSLDTKSARTFLSCFNVSPPMSSRKLPPKATAQFTPDWSMKRVHLACKIESSKVEYTLPARSIQKLYSVRCARKEGMLSSETKMSCMAYQAGNAQLSA